MPRVLDPFRFVLIAVAGWMNQHQLQIIDYLREENWVLREQLGGRRMRLNDDQRHRLAAKAKGLGRKLLLDMLADVGVKSVKLPPRTPNLNAHAERFVRTIKKSCLERMILFREESLRTAVHNFAVHDNNECNHQGSANQLISPEPGHLGKTGVIQRRQRLGGMLNYSCILPPPAFVRSPSLNLAIGRERGGILFSGPYGITHFAALCSRQTRPLRDSRAHRRGRHGRGVPSA